MTLVSLLATVLVGAFAFATPAGAHAKVVSTTPGDGTTVRGDISRIVIRFDDVVTLVPHALTLTTDTGQPVNLESPRIVGGRTLMTFVQDHLAAGRYAVGWRIMADDGHVESSTFGFTVVAAGATGQAVTPAAASAPPPAPGEPIWPVLVAVGIALAAGLGAGLAVRRGLRLVALGPSYPGEPASPAVHGESPSRDAMLRLPM